MIFYCLEIGELWKKLKIAWVTTQWHENSEMLVIHLSGLPLVFMALIKLLTVGFCGRSWWFD